MEVQLLVSATCWRACVGLQNGGTPAEVGRGQTIRALR